MASAARARAAGAAVRPRAAGSVMWRFSRPHTLVATTVSILGIYLIAVAELPGVALGDGPGDLALTLLAGALVNVYIVGLNQVEDVDIDRINKPHLPIAAGDLGLRSARRIVAVAGAGPIVLALTQGWVELAAVVAALAIGTAYSSPPLRLKRFPAIAAMSISIVRALVVNVGVYEHFADSLGGRPELSSIPAPIVALTLFVLPFSFAIAVLKDVPDAEGDRRIRRIAEIFAETRGLDAQRHRADLRIPLAVGGQGRQDERFEIAGGRAVEHQERVADGWNERVDQLDLERARQRG